MTRRARAKAAWPAAARSWGSTLDVVVHAALDLDVGFDQFAAHQGAVGLDGGELGVESQAALALLVGGDPDQPDQLGLREG